MIRDWWTNVDRAVREALLPGSVGAFHRLRLASDTLALAGRVKGGLDAALLGLGLDLLLAAWENDPLNGHLADQLLMLNARMGRLDPGLAGLLGAVRDAWKRPGDLRYYEKLATDMDFAKLRRYLEGQAAKEPGNLFWRQQVLAVGEMDGDLDWLWANLSPAFHKGLAPLGAFLGGWVDFARGDCKRAAARYAQAVPQGSAWPAPLEHRAECLYRLGERRAALDLWRAVLRARPWHLNLLLRVHDALTGLDLAVEPPPGPVAVLLYTWNKAEELGPTLESLFAADARDALVVVLDNGSTDATSEVLAGWRDRVDGDRFSTHALRVNVGAPAARNWLMQLPEVRGREFAAYLDDDVLLPRDWLGRLFAARTADPEAGAWGCRVLDQKAPHLIQSADLHLVTAGGDEPLEALYDPRRATAEPFNVSDLHNQVPDQGQFNYVRPCASVTGCCHLFETARLLAGGGFDIRLSPSQYDDLEHDLRRLAQGGHCCYQGHLAVRHMKRTGKAVRMQPGQYGSAVANKYKLHHLYGPDTARSMQVHEQALLLADLEAKLDVVDAFLTQDSTS